MHFMGIPWYVFGLEFGLREKASLSYTGNE